MKENAVKKTAYNREVVTFWVCVKLPVCNASALHLQSKLKQRDVHCLHKKVIEKFGSFWKSSQSIIIIETVNKYLNNCINFGSKLLKEVRYNNLLTHLFKTNQLDINNNENIIVFLKLFLWNILSFWIIIQWWSIN